MKAEEYFINTCRSQHNVEDDKANKKIQQYDFYDMCGFAEMYAKHIIESISDEEIHNHFIYTGSAKWMKSKLLNKIK